MEGLKAAMMFAIYIFLYTLYRHKDKMNINQVSS